MDSGTSENIALERYYSNCEPAGNAFLDSEDDDLQRRIVNYLSSRHFPAFDTLEIEARDGEVTISGRVKSYYEKQVALNSCQRVAGVISLIDQISVAPK